MPPTPIARPSASLLTRPGSEHATERRDATETEQGSGPLRSSHRHNGQRRSSLDAPIPGENSADLLANQAVDTLRRSSSSYQSAKSQASWLHQPHPAAHDDQRPANSHRRLTPGKKPIVPHWLTVKLQSIPRSGRRGTWRQACVVALYLQFALETIQRARAGGDEMVRRRNRAHANAIRRELHWLFHSAGSAICGSGQQNRGAAVTQGTMDHGHTLREVLDRVESKAQAAPSSHVRNGAKPADWGRWAKWTRWLRVGPFRQHSPAEYQQLQQVIVQMLAQIARESDALAVAATAREKRL